MQIGLIHLCYRKIIDIHSQKEKMWDKYVFDDTYTEFFMQAQYYNQSKKYTTFQEFLQNVPNADKLHGLTSVAAIGYIRQLNGIIPEITNAQGKLCLPFKHFKFEILDSHIQKKELHKIAISFYSEPLTWVGAVGNQVIIAYSDKSEALARGEAIETDMIAMHSQLSISSFQNIPVHAQPS